GAELDDVLELLAEHLRCLCIDLESGDRLVDLLSCQRVEDDGGDTEGDDGADDPDALAEDPQVVTDAELGLVLRPIDQSSGLCERRRHAGLQCQNCSKRQELSCYLD